MSEYSQKQHGARAPLTVRPYQESDEREWLRCSVLSFLDTSYFDSVFRQKPRYEHPAIELVAEQDGMIVGVIDVECEETPCTVCTVSTKGHADTLSGMIWHLAVHPDFQRRGIGGRLLEEARRAASKRNITCFEVWTRDDAGTLRWYETQGFEWVTSYLHVYWDGNAEVRQPVVQSQIPGLRPVHVFAHYVGTDGESIRAQFNRVHDCNCFRLRF